MMDVALEERAFSEVKRLCCAGLDGSALLGEVIERLRRAVPFEAYCASTLDPASGLVTHSLAEEMGGAEEAAIFFERLYFEHDLVQFRRRREWHGLPPAVRMVVVTLRSALKPGCDRDTESIPRLRVRARSGRWLTLYGSLTEATPEWGPETVVVIEPTKPEELLPFSMAAYGLSGREEEIVGLVVQGLSTTRISQNLFISEYTVQNHLRSVFEKTGVRSRGELVRRLFFDNLYPTLFG